MKSLQKPTLLKKLLLYLAIIGPGLITASSGNDAPGIATYSMAGSKYGYSFLWLLLLISFGIVAIQSMAARIGAVTGKGTADLIRERFGVKTTTFAMLGLLIANLGSTIAQFAGVAAAGELFGITRYLTVPLSALLMSYFVLGRNYKTVEKVLLVLCLSALSYVIAVFIIKSNWEEVFRDSLQISTTLSSNFILSVLAVIGTTITPWGIFYIQASVADKEIDVKDFYLTKFDVTFGAIWANLVAGFIIITTAYSLFPAGIVVESAEQAALALEPLAGSAAKILFAIGLLGASLLAVSVLPLSTTYAFCEAFGFERGLNRSVKEAPTFYALFGVIILISVVFVMIPNLPLFQIMWLSQSLNAILLPAILYLLIKIANDHVVMGEYVNKKLTNILSISLTVLISIVTVILLVSPIFS